MGLAFGLVIAFDRSSLDVAARGTYRKIADELRQSIERDELRPGEMLPSELALCERHQVARGTVRAALALLVDEGRIEVLPGQGRRVVGAGPSTPSTAYERIAAALMQRIDGGEFGADDVLPSEAALVAEYGVSRNTVRKAYQRLVDEGVVVVRQGAGAFRAPR
ncbi:winged helix-turn-helix domain-containing protein [Pseudonocardia sp. N23]|uniref:GntR family transcriptional regulator n=1 Tax=Pseudonocardia sp. N23 TaxID=1987376 RepID=UPI000C030E80|nr:winged helix-turn-helix domain-containing protein [Pseudonocardia sp. N23]GAY08717.1 transcriptional regulator of succinyl CoA synthetase operon [Pseudonocardia sp. N23]